MGGAVTTTVCISMDAINGVLSRQAGEQVALLQRGLPGGAHVWMVVPVDRSSMSSARWLAVRALPGSGIWATATEAVAGFGAAWAGGVASSSIEHRGGVPGALAERLSGGPVAASTLIAEYGAAGVSRHRLGRCAGRLGVIRNKVGMTGGWRWSLPAEERTKIATKDMA